MTPTGMWCVYHGIRASGAYSSHKKGILTDLSSGSLLPGVDSFNGLTVYQVETGSPFVMQVTLENNGEKDVETPSVGIYLSTNNVISIADQQLSIYETSLTRNSRRWRRLTLLFYQA